MSPAGRFTARTVLCENQFVKGSEFLRKVQRLAKAKGLRCSFAPSKGKGSHGTLYLESAFTVLKDRKKEIGPGLLRAMCKDLRIDPNEL